MNKGVIFLQKRAHRAGAQTCLARLARHPGMREWNPAVVCSEKGWLTAACDQSGVAHLEVRFPSSRALWARLVGNAAFARRVQKLLGRRPTRPALVHANDHLEGLLGLELARVLQTKSAIFLRSPGMTRDDYFKYRCHQYDLIIAVGDELQQRAHAWDPSRNIKLIHDGICADEFAPPKPKAAAFPEHLLVIGSPLDWKGWADLTEALGQLEQTGVWPALDVDFTGAEPDPARNDLKLGRLKRTHCHFLGRVENFRGLALRYDLVVNPTRMESFGMAAVEVVAAGVPLLSSRTGIIEQVIEQPEFLFPPHRPAELARALEHLRSHWPRLEINVAKCQENIRARFLIDRAVQKLSAEYEQLLK